jgi:hypothetical protein
MEGAWVSERLFYIGDGELDSPNEDFRRIATFEGMKGQGPGTGILASNGR